MVQYTEVDPDRLRSPDQDAARQRRLAVVVLALVLFAGIYALRVADHNPADAVLVLCVVPIALCAVEFGIVGGLAAAMLALGLAGVWHGSDGAELGPLGYLSRAAAFLVLGGGLGALVSKHRTLAQRLRRYHELSLDLLATAGFDGYFKQVNPAWEKLLGHTQAELLSRPFIEFVHPDDRDATQAEAGKLSDFGTDSISFKNRYRTSDGSYRWLEWNARADPHARLIYAIARDVTAQKQAEEAVKEAKEEAERANRAKSEFLSRMSHELRTPLNAVLGFGQLLEMSELDPRQRDNTGQILKGGRHLLKLIDEVLDISRIEAGTMTISLEPVHVSSALGEVLDLVEPLAAERGISLQRPSSDAADRYVLADNQRLRQVLLNLLSNAIKYNREAGSVTVSLQDVAPGHLLILVADTGKGIPAEQMMKLFSPFERLGAERGSVEGTGLGLTVSRLLVEQMGGTLTVESQPRIGATFLVKLALAEAPVASGEALGPGVHGASADGSPRPTGTILYIEDNISNLKLVEQILSERPELHLIAATHGNLGLELAQRHRPDLILLDLHLPGMQGVEVLRRLRADPETWDIPVVVVSADATAGQIQRLLGAGARAYLTKPLDVAQFLQVIEEALSERVGA